MPFYGWLEQGLLGDYYPLVLVHGIAFLNDFDGGVKQIDGVLFLKFCKILRILSMS
jgi:hypothetical protein